MMEHPSKLVARVIIAAVLQLSSYYSAILLIAPGGQKQQMVINQATGKCLAVVVLPPLTPVR